MREKEKSTGVILVRHGQPDFPRDRLYCDDREDPVLTEDGHRHAQEAASMLENEAVDVIYVSPLQRARMTAQPIIDKLSVPFHVEPKLRERPFGIWDGLYFEAIQRDYPEDFSSWKRDPVSFVPEGGESITDHMARICAAIQTIVQAHPGELIVIVMHVGPIRMCVTHALGMPLKGYRQLTVDYGSLTRIDYGKRQNNVIYLNRVANKAGKIGG